ncbi:MAG: FAD-binding oxidoreductase [Cytophagales bacterium]|nr:FAD-binding oxidoreductase [Cytophagales bacterium]
MNIQMLDFLIVGQGIAGSILALQLLKRGKSIVVINNNQAHTASKVATGIYNPITGRKMVMSWKATILLPYLENFYQAMERTLGASFLHPLPMFRPFLTLQEQKEWRTKVLENGYLSFVEAIVNDEYHQENVVNQHGGVVLKQTGYLNIPLFLNATRSYLKVHNAYIEGSFVYNKIRFHSKSVTYQTMKARKIIFCEGIQAKQNPFFNWLPFRLVKGELLSVILPKPINVIYNRGVFVLPVGANKATIGATYDWHDLSCTPTEKARNTLEEKLTNLLKLPYEVVDHKAGIRPATLDRRPFIGLHPQYPHVGIFNGLGTKGVSLAPYLSEVFVNYLLSHGALPAAVQLNSVKRALYKTKLKRS